MSLCLVSSDLGLYMKIQCRSVEQVASLVFTSVVIDTNVLLQLFDRLKLQESSGKKGADSKTVSEELALTNDSQTLSLKVGSGRGRAEEERERQKHLVRAGEKKTPGDRSEADVGSRTAHTEGASAGGARARSQSRRRRRPKVDYQQVFTRHINQIFIRGENVLLVHLAH